MQKKKLELIIGTEEGITLQDVYPKKDVLEEIQSLLKGKHIKFDANDKRAILYLDMLLFDERTKGIIYSEDMNPYDEGEVLEFRLRHNNREKILQNRKVFKSILYEKIKHYGFIVSKDSPDDGD